MSRTAKPTTGQAATRSPLNRERVLGTAIEIADENGVSAVTMRAVASRLGVEAMSLYNHVANKDDLLDGMTDAVVAQVELPDGCDDWRDAMRRRACSAHDVFGRHAWIAAVLDSRGSTGPAGLRYFDWVLGTLVEAGFSPDGAMRAFSLLDSYIYGFAIQQLNFASAGDVPLEERAEALLSFVPVEKYPYLHRVAMHAMTSGYDVESDFGFGLEIILDGLERVLDDAHAH